VAEVQELRLVLTVSDFAEALELCQDALGLTQLADWSEGEAKIVLLDSGRGSAGASPLP
jgi:hypothetical protein